jgi:DNA repair exonuclease SbcCD ATPase subunit
MQMRNLFWIAVPVALSAGVIWLSAQEGKTPPTGVKVGELAEKLQAREKSVAMREADLAQTERRLNTLQATMLQERSQLQAKEKTFDDERAKIQEEKNKFEEEKNKEIARLQELEKSIEAERNRKVTLEKVDNQMIETFEAMDPVAASKALIELAKNDFDVAVAMMSVMQPKRAAKIFDQLANGADAKLAADLSELVGKRQRKK